MGPPDLIALLAHLDFLVDGPKTCSRADVGTEEHIHKVLVELADRFENRYTVEQIRERFWQEFRHGYRYPENNFIQLFRHGSCEMQNLDSETKRLVKQQLDVIYVGEPRRQRSLSRHPRPAVVPRRNRGNATAPARARSSAGKVPTKVVHLGKSKKNKKVCGPSTLIR